MEASVLVLEHYVLSKYIPLLRRHYMISAEILNV